MSKEKKTSTVNEQRFFNHPALGECAAMVIGNPRTKTPVVKDDETGEVLGGGEEQELVRVWPNDGTAPYNTLAVLTDDGKADSTYLEAGKNTREAKKEEDEKAANDAPVKKEVKK
jgi:hypothetical protein